MAEVNIYVNGENTGQNEDLINVITELANFTELYIDGILSCESKRARAYWALVDGALKLSSIVNDLDCSCWPTDRFGNLDVDHRCLNELQKCCMSKKGQDCRQDYSD